MADWTDYIRQRALDRGLDPNLALRTVWSEGGTGNFKIGDQGTSGGPFQLHVGGGLGDEFQRATGLSPLDPNSTKQGIDFALDYAQAHGGFSPNIWHGLRKLQPESPGGGGEPVRLNVGGREGPGQAGTDNQLAAFALLDNLITKQRYAADAEPPQSGSDLLNLLIAGSWTRQGGPKPQEASQELKPPPPPPAPVPDPGNAFSSYVEPPDQGALPPAPAMPNFPQGGGGPGDATDPLEQSRVSTWRDAPPMPPEETPTITDNYRQLPTEPEKPPQSGTELLNQLAGGAGMFSEPGQFPIPIGRPNLAGALGMQPVDEQIVEQGQRETELRQKGASLLQQIVGAGESPFAGAFQPGIIGMARGVRPPRLPGRVEPPMLRGAATGTPTSGGPPPGTVRLYRVEGGGPAKDVPEWIQQGQQDSGQAEATGRWFTPDPEAVEWYRRDSGEGARVSYVDVPAAEAEKYRVANLPDDLKYGTGRPIKSYSRDPQSEFFLPRELAETKRPVPSSPNETPTGGGDPARAAGGIAEATPSVSETQAPATAAGSGFRPPPETSNATSGSGGKQNPPAITNVKLAQSLDDDLYRLRQNGQARMIEARQAFDSLRREYRRPDLQERAYTEIEQRMVDPNAPISDSTREIERVMAKSAARANDNARWIQQNAPDIAGELRDLPTAEQGYVHRKVVGRDIPGERLDPAQRDPISGAGGRSLSKRASGVQHRRPNYVIQDNAGNRVWQKGVLGQKGELSRYGETFTDPRTGVKWTAKQPTTAEIEKNTATRYQKHYALNTMDNDLRLGRVRANIELLNEWKPKLMAAEKFFPDGENAMIPPGFVHVDLPQLRGYAEPHVADVLNEFYAASRDDIVSYFEKANHFLIGTMFALPVRHIENVGAHYVVGRGFDWLYSNPMLAQATREVASQGPRYLRYLKAGAGLQYPSTLNENFYGVMLEKAFREQSRDPTWIAVAKDLAKDLGTNPATAIKELVKAEYAWSRRALWKVNDIFLTARIMELERQGLPMMQAIRQAEKEIPNYRIPTEVMHSRRLAQAMKSPLAIAFGRYSYGRGKALSEMIKDMFGKEATGRERVRAVGQAAVLALLGTTLYDTAKTGLNMAMQGMGLRGPDDKPLEPGGFGPIGIVRKVPEYVAAKLGLTDSQLEFAQVLSTLITPAPGTSMIESLGSGGRDPFTGQKYIEPESSTQGKLVQGAEFLAKPIYPLQLGIEAARKGIVPALGPPLGYNEEYQGPSGKVTKMQRRAAKNRENRDPIQRGIGSAMEYFGLQ